MVQALGQIYAQLVCEPVVVGPDEGRVVVGLYLPVEQYHGDSGPVGFGNHRGQGLGLVRRHHQQIHALVYQALNVGYLLPGVILHRLDDQVYVLPQHGLHAQLLVDFIAPEVFGALRYPYREFLFLMAGGKRKKDGRGQYAENFHGRFCLMLCNNRINYPFCQLSGAVLHAS